MEIEPQDPLETTDGLLEEPPLSARPPLSRRSRLLRLAGVGIIVLAGLTVLIGSQASLRAALPGISMLRSLIGIHAPRPLTVRSNVSWVSLVVDGHPASGGLATPLALTPGRHQVELDAPPFRPVHCAVTMQSDGHVIYVCDSALARCTTWCDTLDVGYTLANLPPAQQHQAISAIAMALQQIRVMAIVSPGELYLPGKVAHMPLIATLVFRLPVPSPARLARGPLSLNDCLILCPEDFAFPGPGISAGAHYWEIQAPLLPLWQFTQRGTGVPVASNVPAWPNELQQLAELEAARSPRRPVNWPTIGLQMLEVNGQWEVGPPPINIAMSDDRLGNMLVNALCSNLAINAGIIPPISTVTNHGLITATSASAVPAANPGDGCFISVSLAVTPPQPTAPVMPVQDAAYLYRWGLIFPLNTLARDLSPTLPHPDTAAVTLAQQLRNIPAGAFTLFAPLPQMPPLFLAHRL
jgi:hypothetical protein